MLEEDGECGNLRLVREGEGEKGTAGFPTGGSSDTVYFQYALKDSLEKKIEQFGSMQ